jgi:peptide deformylase
MSIEPDLIQLKIFPHNSLRKKATDFDDFAFIKLIFEEMSKIMYLNSGIGLAANQVGLNKRLFIMDLSESQTENRLFINPKIISASKETQTLTEGCLSLPGLWHKVTRSNHVVIRYTDINEKEREEEFIGLASACVQHEIDHLDGILFPDRVPPFKQAPLWKKYIESVKIKK